MRDGPSSTALGAARHRAIHQVVDGAALFADPFALPIAGFADAGEAEQAAAARPGSAPMRWFIAARSRFAEERVAAAVAAGTRHVVVLGAGLDTLAYRWAPPPGARILEVDHPATQAWKRRRLAEIGVAEPGHLTYVGVDLEHEDLAGALRAAGLPADAGAFVLWLGVLPYLTLGAVAATLRSLAGLGRVDVVLDYGEPLADRAGPGRDAFASAAARVAEAGEPWITFLTPVHLRLLLRETGFVPVEDVDVGTYVAAVLGRPSAGRRSPAHLVHARTAARP